MPQPETPDLPALITVPLIWMIDSETDCRAFYTAMFRDVQIGVLSRNAKGKWNADTGPVQVNVSYATRAEAAQSMMQALGAVRHPAEAEAERLRWGLMQVRNQLSGIEWRDADEVIEFIDELMGGVR